MASDSKNTQAEQPAEPALSVSDFCARLSETVTRPELISAFARSESKAGRVTDTEKAFRGRYEKFINKPV